MWLLPLQEAWSPAEVALRLAREPGLVWLDGGLLHGREGRFSFVACAPSHVVSTRFGDSEPLACLNALAGLAPEDSAHDPAIAAEDVPRWIGHIAYDAHPIARARFRHSRDRRVPSLRFARYDTLYVFDHERGLAFVAGDGLSPCQAFAARLQQNTEPVELAFRVGAVTATPEEQHTRAIQTALRHIRDGDVYQINLARRFAARFSGSALGLFMRMREASPVPLGFFSQAEDHALLGRSMERFLRYRTRDGALWTSPIKGTIARAGDDFAEAERLRSDDKEHAEHAMVVDLMRNDLSRVSQTGSVAVREPFTVLPFAGLSHLISTVSGRAQPGLTLATLIERTFPPGSVTGTPKERAMTVIEELEPAARGVYTGALGFVDRTGGLSLSVAIRTAVVSGDEVEYFAGGGIVWGSDAARECAETELKARVFLDALR